MTSGKTLGESGSKESWPLVLPSDQDKSGRTLGVEELEELRRVIESGMLFSVKGTAVKSLEKAFAEKLGVRHAFACSSGSAAVHAAVAAVDPSPGDEIVTTPITDMGALTAIVYQSAIPVFADVDPRTWNVTAATIEPCLSERTKAIVITHLFGNPCDTDPILEMARARGIPVIEDAAQALGAAYKGKPAGALASIGCFSLQQGKHITCGEGGMVVADDDDLARRMFLFINKAWGYGDERPDHYFLAPNYRMSELQGAVTLAQLAKLDGVVGNRIESAARLTALLSDLPGLETPWSHPGGIHSYWKYCLRVDPAVIPAGAVGLASRLKDLGVQSVPRYIQKPAFRCQVFAEQKTFGKSTFPFDLARPEAVDYSEARFPGAFEGLERILVLPWNENYTDEHVNYIAASIRRAIGRE